MTDGLDLPDGDEVADLPDLLHDVADELGDATSTATGDVTTWMRGGRAFATASSTAVEMRLDPEIAEAALRTPGTTASPRGPGWVRLSTVVDDRTVVDRAEAWFKIAWRAARSTDG